MSYKYLLQEYNCWNTEITRSAVRTNYVRPNVIQTKIYVIQKVRAVRTTKLQFF